MKWRCGPRRAWIHRMSIMDPQHYFLCSLSGWPQGIVSPPPGATLPHLGPIQARQHQLGINPPPVHTVLLCNIHSIYPFHSFLFPW